VHILYFFEKYGFAVFRIVILLANVLLVLQFTGPRGEMNSVQSKLNTLESKLNMMENRQQAMTNAINREISKLEMDTRSIKTVINTLAEDNYKTHSQIDVLKGNGLVIKSL
jgi:septal ring factor EnvC (AmiA/AmiB activator)